MNIGTIAVVGAGTVGCQIAYLAALAGCRTVLEELSGQRIGEALEALRRIAAAEVEAGRLSAPGVAALLGRIEPESTLEYAGSEADLILEAAPEDLETKIEVYTILDRAAPPRTIFVPVGNAGVAEIASLTYRAARVVGMRFGPLAVTGPGVKLVRGPETSAETVAAAAGLARQMGKRVVVVTESDGSENGSPERQTGA